MTFHLQFYSYQIISPADHLNEPVGILDPAGYLHTNLKFNFHNLCEHFLEKI